MIYSILSQQMHMTLVIIHDKGLKLKIELYLNFDCFLKQDMSTTVRNNVITFCTAIYLITSFLFLFFKIACGNTISKKELAKSHNQ